LPGQVAAGSVGIGEYCKLFADGCKMYRYERRGAGPSQGTDGAAAGMKDEGNKSSAGVVDLLVCGCGQLLYDQALTSSSCHRASLHE